MGTAYYRTNLTMRQRAPALRRLFGNRVPGDPRPRSLLALKPLGSPAGWVERWRTVGTEEASIPVRAAV
ncbi:hypothetical protein WEB32_34065 [Streptomyces netropsis]|uniref:hypothetical protein n=1 Tax=Streptomyces netropsis TaxID=55404 RepID=UPI0030D0519D